MCKLIMDAANLVQQFQQKQLIVFKFPVSLWRVFVLLILLVCTGGRFWIASAEGELGWEEKRSGKKKTCKNSINRQLKKHKYTYLYILSSEFELLHAEYT